MAITHSRYSFVRINEEGVEISACNSQSVGCLPVSEMADLRFQLIADFDHSNGGVSGRLVALPCNVCNELTEEEIYEYAFGKEMLEVVDSSDNDGLLRVELSANFSDIAVGHYVRLSNACHDAHLYDGVYEVVEIESGTNNYTLNTPFAGTLGPGDDCNEFLGTYLTNFVKSPHLLASVSAEIPDNSEFPGDNYVWNLAEPVPTNPIPFNDGECLRLCIYRVTATFGLPGTLPELDAAVCIGTTNCFRKTSDQCFTTRLAYGCDENAFGFYGEPFLNVIRLPLYLKNPQFPGEEKGYQKSDGTFVKLAERINKRWELETDYIPDAWHERLRVALSCDTVSVTNENANLHDEGIYRSEGYEIEWLENTNHPLAKGKTKVMKRRLVASVNSNCG